MTIKLSSPQKGKRGAPSHRPAGKRESDLIVMADLYCKGWPQYKIAEHLKLSNMTVSNDIKVIHQRWREACLSSYDEKVNREIAKIDLLEAEAWAEYNRSKEPAEQVSTRKVKRGKAKGLTLVEENRNTKGQCGNPAYLQIINECGRRRAGLLGLIVNKQSMTTPDGQEPAIYTEQDSRDILKSVFIERLQYDKAVLNFGKEPDPAEVNVIPPDEQEQIENRLNEGVEGWPGNNGDS